MKKRKMAINVFATILFFSIVPFSLADESPLAVTTKQGRTERSFGFDLDMGRSETQFAERSVKVLYGRMQEDTKGWKGGEIARTSYGEIEGLLSPNDIVSWVGIPFAKPPVGDLRWKRPKEPEKWEDVRQAYEFCDQCTQYNEYGDIVGSEDCLYLNVWRPDSDAVDLPVYFWIHGGGNSIGSASYSNYDGSNIAAKNNVVVVSANYRLGPLGWFTHPSLRKDRNGTRINDSGNYGTLDIIMALKWVKENIGSFGGDPNNVTIAGESSGGANVYSLLLSPLAAGLFHKAIVQSGFPWEDSVADGDTSAERVIDALMANDGITREGMKENQIADYLRSKTAEDILSTYTPTPTGMLDANKPDVYNEFCQIFPDGTVLPSDDFISVFWVGQYNQVPIIIGSNEEEQKLNLFPLLLGTPPMPPCDYQDLALFLTETTFGYLTELMANLLSSHQPGEIYVYRFLYGTYRYDPDNNCEPDPEAFNAWSDPRPYFPYHLGLMFGACHTLDIPFFFGNFDNLIFGDEFIYLIFPDYYSGYKLLSDTMMEYTANFAYTGNPGGVDGVIWAPWSTLTAPRILFDADEDEAIVEMVESLD